MQTLNLNNSIPADLPLQSLRWRMAQRLAGWVGPDEPDSDMEGPEPYDSDVLVEEEDD